MNITVAVLVKELWLKLVALGKRIQAIIVKLAMSL